MRIFLNKLWDIRGGEGRRTVLMFLYFFLIVFSFYILKPVRSSLFLEKLGSARLPYVYLGTTALIALITPLYTRLAQRLPKWRLIAISMLVLSLNLVGFRWLLNYQWFGVAAAFYIWVNLFSTITIPQFWLFANGSFNSREAKRLFGFIGSGGILGGVAGGSFTRWTAPVIGTENLLLVCILPLIGCIVIVNHIKRGDGEVEKERIGSRAGSSPVQQSAKGSLALLWESKYLQWIALILGLATIVSTLIDYQFNVIAEQRFPGKDAKTEFFGNFFACVNACVFLFQLFFTGRILKRFGIGVSLLLLPWGLMLGSFAVFAFPLLWTVMFAKGADWGLRYSVDQSARELLYLPISAEVKSKVKPLLDMLGSRLSEGIAAGLLLGLTVWFSFALRAISLVAIGFIAIWIFAVFAIKKEYLKLLAGLLAHQNVDVRTHFVSALDASTVQVLFEALEDADEERVLYALDLLELAKGVNLRPVLKHLLNHPSKRVQVKVLHTLFEIREKSVVEEVERLVGSDEIEVQTEAIRYVCVYGGGSATERMKDFLGNSNPQVRAATLVCAARQLEPQETEKDRPPNEITDDEELPRLVQDGFAEIVGEKGPNGLDVRVAVAKEFRSIEAPAFLRFLIELLNDESLIVVNQAIQSAGHLKRHEFIPILLEKLLDKGTTREAQAALAAYGNPIVPFLKDALLNPEMVTSIRRSKRSKDSRVAEQVSRVLSRIGTQAAVNALIESLLQFWTEQRESIDRNEALNQKSGAALRHPIIKALNRLRRDQPSLNFPKEQVYTGIRFEARNYAQILGWLHALTPISADDLLMLALKEKLTQSLECLFRTLGLIYPSQAIYNAYSPLHQQLTHPDSSRTALGPNALELLDNLLEPEIKRWVLPLIDDTPIETRLKHAETLWGQKAMTLSVMEGSDSWLRACAIYTFGQKTSLGRADELNLLEKVTFLKHTEIFADIPTEQLAKLAAVAQEVHFEDGSVIFEQNDYTDSMYILIEGHVQTSGEGGPDKTGVQSNPDTIGIQSDLSETIGEGEVFGMYALLTNEPRLVTARAIEETHVLKIERDAFFDLLSEHAEIALGLLKNMVQKIKALSIQPNLLHRQGESIK